VLQRLDFSRTRPRHPKNKFKPRTYLDFIAAIEANVLKDKEVRACERLQTGIARAALETFPQRAKPSASWYDHFARILDPL